MATTPEQIVWTGQGPIYIGVYDPSKSTPDMGYLSSLYRVGCGTRTLTTTLSRETKKIKESCSGQRLDLMEIETGKSLEIKIELTQFDRRTLAAAFFGKDIIQSAGTIQKETLPTVAEGDYVFFKHPKVTGLILEDSASPTPAVLTQDIDWQWDSAAHGAALIKKLPAGIIQPLQASYSHGEHTSIAAFSASSIQRGLLFNGSNQSGQHARVAIPRISLAMDGDFAWLGDEESTLSLSGSALYVPELAQSDWGGFMRIDALPI